ncbi:MAG: TetR/AcrR family transcriptional regulator [Pikeienuella sp.]
MVATQKKPAIKPADRAETTQARICAAVVDCIDQRGYAETSISHIQARAGVSRGALTHHFPSKQALVAEAALRMLSAAAAPMQAWQSAPDPYDMFVSGWNRTLNTSEGRAFAEILTACRTDDALRHALSDGLLKWESENANVITTFFTGSSPEDDDAVLIWSIYRSFIRGLLSHERFVTDPDYLDRMVRRFAEIVKPHLSPRLKDHDQ